MKTEISKYLPYSLIIALVLVFFGCKKQNEFLDAKPNQSLVVPTSLADFQTLLNNTNVFNSGNDPALGELSSDDYYIASSVLPFLSATERNAYSWNKVIYNAGSGVNDWNAPYLQIYYANEVLDGLSRGSFPPGSQIQYNELKGSALFYRSYAFYNLVQTFALPYNAATAKTDPGIPLRLNADLTVKSVRATEQTCYNQILSDLKAALPLLPARAAFPTQPSQAAVNATLARIYLAIGDYSNAFIYSDACLKTFSTLVDFNTLNSPTATAINSTFMAEDIYHSSLNNYSTIAVRRNTVIDSGLYASYGDNDLRKTKFFGILDNLPQFPRFVGSYDFTGNKYDGLATDEVMLIRAECNARAGNAAAAMLDLNGLLTTRWKTGTFVPFTAGSQDEALSLILSERRKELPYRGLRWTDMRRFNLDSRFKVTLTRNVGGVTYVLAPGDPKYAMPIPDNEIAVSNIPQNQR
ncbi:MAG: RagB/SusD family nutrient uptake outer membrane protein [Mucilaginibacter sp.]|nr:RagB/SusD family nutrient uptake outer membrane protein [Mucilaginibacter sp.]